MRIIYTVGHSNRSVESFLCLLASHRIEAVADVRSFPYTRYAVHFNRETIEPSLRSAGLKYVYLGKQVGGMPKDQSLYDEDGNLNYALIRSTDVFKGGIERLITGSLRYRVALMCAEADPSGCHRRHLIGPALEAADITVQHILADGSLVSQCGLDLQCEAASCQQPQQLSLF